MRPLIVAIRMTIVLTVVTGLIYPIALTGIAQSTLSNYKRGIHQAEYASTFKTFADGLGMPVPLRQALGLSGDNSPDRPASVSALTPAGTSPTLYSLSFTSFGKPTIMISPLSLVRY